MKPEKKKSCGSVVCECCGRTMDVHQKEASTGPDGKAKDAIAKLLAKKAAQGE